MMLPPTIAPVRLNLISVHLPKRDELSLRVVLALPNDSMSGLDLRICCSSDSVFSPVASDARPDASARNWSTSFIVSVLPAPDSPEITTAWSRKSASKFAYALSAMAKMCGGWLREPRSLYLSSTSGV